MPEKGPDVLKVPEVATDLRVDPKVVYDLIRSGRLRALRLGRRQAIRVTRAALDELKAGDGAQAS
jgi:excisionase family DNA binding protein